MIIADRLFLGKQQVAGGLGGGGGKWLDTGGGDGKFKEF